MEAQQPRRAGRPRTPLLSRQIILETALRLLDERGESGAGMREIARELGVRPSALYNHVAGREDLVGGIRELISDRIDVACFDELAWDDALICWADSYRAAFAAHVPTVALLATTPLTPDSRTSLMYDAVVRALMRAGWPEQRVLTVIVAIESFLLGAALDAAADPAMLDPGSRPDTAAFASAFASRSADLAAAGIDPATAAYQLGIRALVAGLRAEFVALYGAQA
ncbi:helix-turn-helix transcriptional regulator [Leucobacter insecticola]|uniref:Helix-turn-helix transcriptional regulator n=2 Tax=Leucobacter insecticola TaxID=2714934 RepID=A0A6G8FHH6_9MICO|nr:helix-turn-helix transcriptional regulator [Leucobacter insecticola]